MIEPKIIAEVGCNHRGDFDTAIELIKVAALFGNADVVKFQKRNNRELLSIEEYEAPHPNPQHAYGESYGAHREHLEFSIGEHQKLKQACEEWGVVYATSVWDRTSAREVIGIEPQLIKVPSACNLNFKLLEILADEYQGEVHLSFGMTTREEEASIVEFFESRNAAHRLVLYSCTSGYPVPFEDICLHEITRLKDAYGTKVKAIGFSGHHLGIAADIGALTLGATWFERHFTLDRTWKGTDHAASLEPNGLRKLVRDLRNVSLSLKTKDNEILPIEQEQRQKLKRL